MRFEARELPAYSEPVRAAELREGEHYFVVRFLDTEMLIPALEVVVFIGRDLAPSSQGALYFQDAASYRHGARWGKRNPPGVDPDFLETPEEVGRGVPVYTYDNALDILLGCALRRRGIFGTL